MAARPGPGRLNGSLLLQEDGTGADDQCRRRGEVPSSPGVGAPLTRLATSARGTSTDPTTRARGAASPATGRSISERLVHRSPFSPRPAGGPASTAAFKRADGSTWA